MRHLPEGGAEGDFLTDRLTDEALSLLDAHAARPEQPVDHIVSAPLIITLSPPVAVSPKSSPNAVAVRCRAAPVRPHLARQVQPQQEQRKRATVIDDRA